MTRPAKSDVYVMDVAPMAASAEELDAIITTALECSHNVHQTIHRFDWDGAAHDAALIRADRQVEEDHAMLSALGDLRDAEREGAASMGPMISRLRTDGQALEADDFTVAEDWTVTDAWDYDAMFPVARVFGPDMVAALTAKQAVRADDAKTATARLQPLADELGEADRKTGARISKATEALNLSIGRAPTTAGNGKKDGPTIQLVDNETPAPGDQPYTATPFVQTDVAEGGTPKSMNKQGIRGDEGVLISGNRIVYGDTINDKGEYLGAPMYGYTLDEKGMPIISGDPIHGDQLEEGIPLGQYGTGSRLIPTGSTGPKGMPNGTNLLFGKMWDHGPPGSKIDPLMPNETRVYDTNSGPPFHQVATLPYRDVTALPLSDNRLLMTGVDPSDAQRHAWITAPQTAPGDYGFLNQPGTPIAGQIPTDTGRTPEPTASLFSVQTPTGTQYGIITPTEDHHSVEVRLSPTPEGMMNAAPTQIIAPDAYPGSYLYSPTVTQAVAQPDGSVSVSMTLSERNVPNGVDGGDLANQTYRDVFGNFGIKPAT